MHHIDNDYATMTLHNSRQQELIEQAEQQRLATRVQTQLRNLRRILRANPDHSE